jgi:two-component system KDP operon response regulator KdpE
MKFLVVEDNRQIAETVSMAFEVRWPEAQVIIVGEGKKAVVEVEAEHPDLMVLDLGLPDMNGFEVLKEVRLFSTIPILILTVRDDESDIVRCLERGADDYVIKPFRQLELMSRVQAILRRYHLVNSSMLPFYGKLRFGQSIHKLYVGQSLINLTSTEGTILVCLMRNAEKIVSLSHLSDVVWGDDYSGSHEALRVYVRRLRKKIEIDPDQPKIILTHPGIGYSLHMPE